MSNRYKEGLISIIIPVYNVEDYLRKCINSVVQQTYKNIEIILVDDGSADESGAICDEYAQKDIRIKVYHKRNGGSSSARNYGLRYAEGEYIGFVDSDDYIDTDMYEILINEMAPDIDIVSCGTILEYPQQMKIKKQVSYVTREKQQFSGKQSIEELLLARDFSFSVCDKIFRREVFEGIKFPLGRSSEDLPVTFDLFLKSRNIVNIGRVKYHYIYRDDSNSRQQFFYRRVDYAVFAGKICKEVTMRYPQLRKQAEAFYISCLAHIINRIKECSNRENFVELENRLKKILVKLLIRNVFNKYIGEQEKLFYFNTMIERKANENGCVK